MHALPESIANKTVKQRRSKVIDMCFYWYCIRDVVVKQGKFLILWPATSPTTLLYQTSLH
jgi:hypothetical protein